MHVVPMSFERFFFYAKPALPFWIFIFLPTGIFAGTSSLVSVVAINAFAVSAVVAAGIFIAYATG